MKPRPRFHGTKKRTLKACRLSARAYVLNALQPNVETLVRCYGLKEAEAREMIAEVRGG
jgi:hypothetical protein